MTSGVNGQCGCPLGRHHAHDCPNYIDVWETCPCPHCAGRRADAERDLADVLLGQARDRDRHQAGGRGGSGPA